MWRSGAGESVSRRPADPFSHEMFWTDGRAAFVRADGQDTPLAPTGAFAACGPELRSAPSQCLLPRAVTLWPMLLAARFRRGWSRPRWRSPGSPRVSEQPISRTVTRAQACTCPAIALCEALARSPTCAVGCGERGHMAGGGGGCRDPCCSRVSGAEVPGLRAAWGKA